MKKYFTFLIVCLLSSSLSWADGSTSLRIGADINEGHSDGSDSELAFEVHHATPIIDRLDFLNATVGVGAGFWGEEIDSTSGHSSFYEVRGNASADIGLEAVFDSDFSVGGAVGYDTDIGTYFEGSVSLPIGQRGRTSRPAIVATYRQSFEDEDRRQFGAAFEIPLHVRVRRY